MKTAVVIPTYNEKENISFLLECLLALPEVSHIVIADDNSPDGTGAEVERLSRLHPQIHLIKRPKKMGIGLAYQDGFRYAVAMDVDYIIQMDADLSHDPKYIPEFLEQAKKADVVIGSRYIRGIHVVDWPFNRLVLSYIANLFTRFIVGFKIRDWTSGFKCFRKEALKEIPFERTKADGYAFQIEMTEFCLRKKFIIKEIPIVFVNRSVGSSKMEDKIIREAFFTVSRLGFERLKISLHLMRS
ncbi:MAG: polyprenol monophosphomannose synthase [Candidatus Omnitrophota bacterium]|jgi:dolichol-phosphate mannosyltransferase